MKKLGCAKCGGMKKMKTGGTNNVNISKPGAGYAPRQVGGDNQKMNMYGIAQTGQGQMDGKTGVMKKGGMVKKSLMKAQMGKTVKTKSIPDDVYKRDSTNYSNAANKYLNPTTKKEYQEGADSLKAIKSRYGTPNALEIKMKRTVGGSDLKKNGGSVKKMQVGGTSTAPKKSVVKKTVAPPKRIIDSKIPMGGPSRPMPKPIMAKKGGVVKFKKK